MRRFAALYVLPTVALLLLAVAPLVTGGETLYLRDVLNTHLQKKVVQADAMMAGRLPAIDPRRDGGQPLLGNPNAVPLYPDNALYTLADPFWALNAHFWIHLLLAPFAFFWLGRAWGLGREAAWAGGVAYAGSGYFLSTMNLYNLVAGATLAPALAAAALGLDRGRRRGVRIALTAGLWALLLVAGDPMTAVLALFLALTALAIRSGVRRGPWLRGAAALTLGTLLAAPQWVEFLRILPLSFRGHAGFSTSAATAASWSPAAVLEWLLPFAFGLPDLGFWGRGLFAGEVPLFPTLYPGLLALVLVVASGRPGRPAARWALLAVALGLFLAAGRHNPAMGWLLQGPAATAFRLPAKFWLLVATGAAMLVGLGFERLLLGPGRRIATRALALLATLYGAVWVWLTLFPEAAFRGLRSWVPAGFSDGFVEAERVRWAGLCLVSLLLVAAAALAVALVRRRPVVGGAVLLALHLAVQLLLLRPAVPTDEVAAYLEPPALLAEVGRDDLVVWGSTESLFGAEPMPVGAYPDRSLRWLQRQVFRELRPPAGILWGRRYELTLSPEGLDSFLSRTTAQSFGFLDDTRRVRLLAASGVEVLLLARPLEGVPADEAILAARHESPTGTMRVYRLPGATPEIYHVSTIERAPHLNAALELLTAPGFDPSNTVVLPGNAGSPENAASPENRESPGGRAAVEGAPGRVEVLVSGPEHLRVRVGSATAGALVVQRAWLPLYLASVDGLRTEVSVANMHRLAVELPAGSHVVELWIDRRPLRWSLGVSLVAFVALAALALRRPEAERV